MRQLPQVNASKNTFTPVMLFRQDLRIWTEIIYGGGDLGLLVKKFNNFIIEALFKDLKTEGYGFILLDF